MRAHRSHVAVAGFIFLLAVATQINPQHRVDAAPTGLPGTSAINYPHFALYDGNRSWGYPTINDDGTLSTSTIDQLAKYSFITLEPTPFTDVRTDVIDQLRQRNANMKILGYILPFYALRSYSDPNYYYQKIWALANDSSVSDPNAAAGPNNSWLYKQSGSLFAEYFTNINLAKRTSNGDGTYTYTTAEAIANLIIQNIISKHDSNGRVLLDGMFFDGMTYDIGFLDDAYHLDYVRAGYSDDQSFRDGWKTAVGILADRLRQAAGPDFILSANSGNGTSALYSNFNGWMYENFPAQEGGTWQNNMFWYAGGYMFNESLYRQPPYNFLNTWTNADTPTDPTTMRRERLGLGSASLGSGWAIFGDGSRGTDSRAGGYRYDLWWFDEYAVDLTTGQSSTSGQKTGWRGQPTADMYQMSRPNAMADLVPLPGLETNATGWNIGSNSYGSVSRDTTVSQVGNASIKTHVTTGDSVVWYQVSAATALPSPVTSGLTYALTFWANSSTARRINVVLAPTGQPALAEQLVPLSVGWKQYQIVLTPNSSGLVNLRFDVSETAGDIWFDDIHVQRGATSVYRRDFDHGTVLVNPDTSAQSVTLEKPYKKITGITDPTTNDGSTVTSLNVPAQDAIFLLNLDITPPSPVADLQVRS